MTESIQNNVWEAWHLEGQGLLGNAYDRDVFNKVIESYAHEGLGLDYTLGVLRDELQGETDESKRDEIKKQWIKMGIGWFERTKTEAELVQEAIEKLMDILSSRIEDYHGFMESIPPELKEPLKKELTKRVAKMKEGLGLE